MDEAKLRALREKYADAKGSDGITGKFKDVADALFSDENFRSKPYAGISSFLDLPLRENAEGLDIALIGVPMDLGVTNRPGARFGPRAIRDIERIGPYNHVQELAPHTICKAADIGDVPFRSRFSLEDSFEDIAAFYKEIVATGARVLSIGARRPGAYRCSLRHLQ